MRRRCISRNIFSASGGEFPNGIEEVAIAFLLQFLIIMLKRRSTSLLIGWPVHLARAWTRSRFAGTHGELRFGYRVFLIILAENKQSTAKMAKPGVRSLTSDKLYWWGHCHALSGVRNRSNYYVQLIQHPYS
jgi:hypothetical protein